MSIFKGKLPIAGEDARLLVLERIVEERDRLYDSRFRASEIAVQAALLAQKEAVAAAFLASEKAIVKAEEAQKTYNVGHNDLSRKMDDQYKLMMPHVEAMGLFKAHDDKLEAMRLFFDSKLENQRLSFEKNNENLLKEIGSLRESRSEGTGKHVGATALWAYFVGGVGMLVGISGLLIALFKP